MSLLEKQLLMVQKLRESMPFDDRAYFYLTPVLNTKVHEKRKDGLHDRRGPEKGFA